MSGGDGEKTRLKGAISRIPAQETRVEAHHRRRDFNSRMESQESRAFWHAWFRGTMPLVGQDVWWQPELW